MIYIIINNAYKMFDDSLYITQRLLRLLISMHKLGKGEKIL